MSVLIKVEVAKKQTYIFASNKLKDNVTRSNHISYVTGSEYFNKIAKDIYTEKENLVYSGGGHAVLQFDNKVQAGEFIKLITTDTLMNYSGLELFCKQMEYDESIEPQKNLRNLSVLLEAKKSRRKESFGTISFGIEALDEDTFNVVEKDTTKIKNMEFSAFSEFDFAKRFEDITQNENFLAVIHVDGNSMGKRIEKIYADANSNFEELAEKLRKFSDCIQQDFELAFYNMLVRILGAIEYDSEKEIPIRPIILAGDDVCFVTKGSIGLECARIFLEELTQLENEQDKETYAACAGVAMVHIKFPFYRAYQLSEELCSNAKKFGAAYYGNGSVSSIDWHIEYGQLKNHLSEIRKDYMCEDGNIMTLRPMTVIDPNIQSEIPVERKYAYFNKLCVVLQNKKNNVNHGKLKQLREPLKQGEVESAYFIEKKEIQDIVYNIIEATYGDKSIEEMLDNKELVERTKKEIFKQLGDKKEKYCLCFDAIEMIDLYREVLEENDGC